MLGNFVFSNPTNYILERIHLSISMRNCQNMEKCAAGIWERLHQEKWDLPQGGCHLKGQWKKYC